MKPQYYYLIASLPELLSADEYKNHPIPEFFQFCSEECAPDDYLALKKCFILNDIRNISTRAKGEFIEPAYYSSDEIAEGLSDPDLFFPFITEVFDSISRDSRERTSTELERALVISLFEHIDEFASGFQSYYLQFELLARNIAVALGHRAVNKAYGDLIIPVDFLSERIAKSPAPDFGLGGEIIEFIPILETYKKQSPIEIERAFDRIRWNHLDDMVGHDIFSADAVCAYAVKLSMVERWLGLDPDEGRRMLDRLIAGAADRAASMIHEQLEV